MHRRLPVLGHGRPFTEQLDVYKVVQRSSRSSQTTRTNASSPSRQNRSTGGCCNTNTHRSPRAYQPDLRYPVACRTDQAVARLDSGRRPRPPQRDPPAAIPGTQFRDAAPILPGPPALTCTDISEDLLGCRSDPVFDPRRSSSHRPPPRPAPAPGSPPANDAAPADPADR